MYHVFVSKFQKQLAPKASAQLFVSARRQKLIAATGGGKI
jgi:hypothetical protein